MAKTRIIVGIADDTGCAFYRCRIPYKYLSELGFDVYITNKLGGINFNSADVLVLSRLNSEVIFKIAKNLQLLGGKVVYEIDDYLHDFPPNNPCKINFPKGGKQLKNIEEFMKMSDLFTVSTPTLANNYNNFAKNIKVCYNHIDSNDIQINVNDIDVILNQNSSDSNNSKSIVNLGWAGSATHLDDLIQIVKPVTDIMKEYPQTKFTFVGENYRNLFPRELHKRIFHAGHTQTTLNGKFANFGDNNPVVEYYDLLRTAKLDIAIAPLINMSFNRAKSWIKLLEYSISGIPFVASRFGPYAQYINESKTKVGFLAESNSEWKKALKTLIENKDLRIEIAKNNLINVQTNYTMNTGKSQWVDALASIGVYPDGSEGSYTENIVKW